MDLDPAQLERGGVGHLNLFTKFTSLSGVREIKREWLTVREII